MHAAVTGVIHAHDDERLDPAFGDEHVGHLAEPPVLAAHEGRLGIEQVLPVVHVEHGIAAAGLVVVAGRQVDDHIARTFQETRRKRGVPDEMR